MGLAHEELTAIVGILESSPVWAEASDRRQFLEEALYAYGRQADILNRTLKLEGSPHATAFSAVKALDNFGPDDVGRRAICLLIEALKPNVGRPEHDKLGAIAGRLGCTETVSEPQKGDNTMLPSEFVGAGIAFLFEIGRWAKNELSENWKLRRKEKEIELSKDEPNVTPSDEAMLQALLTDAAIELGNSSVRQVLEIIRRNYSLYLDQDQRSAAAREQYNLDGDRQKRDMVLKDIAKEKEMLLQEIKRLGRRIGLAVEKFT